MRWRWDQGRLTYFQFDTLVAIAKVLCSLDGLSLITKDDLLRKPLQENTEMPFAPSHYKVWRNYARVFGCAMLATRYGDKLIVSEICKKLANTENPFTPDEYFNFVFSHFVFPYPAFDDYSKDGNTSFPFVAIIKFLIANGVKGVSLNDVFEYIIGNDCTGLEEISFYKSLKKTGREPTGDEKRQVREMLNFMGQASYIRWFDSRLYLDTSDFDAILSATVPFISGKRKKEAGQEFLRLTSLKHYLNTNQFEVNLQERHVSEFAVREDRKAFATHNKIERSPLVRERFFKLHPDKICDACNTEPNKKYTWLNEQNILELHHVLPLSATLLVNGTTTTLDDLKPLCPNCHRSIHIFYRNKLNEWNLPDFSSREMASDVYDMAKRKIKI